MPQQFTCLLSSAVSNILLFCYRHKDIFGGLFFLKGKTTATEESAMALVFKGVLLCSQRYSLLFSSLCFWLHSAFVKLTYPNYKHPIIVARVAFIKPRNYEKVNAFNMTSSKENIPKTFHKLVTFSLFFFLLQYFLLWDTKHTAIMKSEKFTVPYLYLPTVWTERTASLGRNGELFPSRLCGNNFHILDLHYIPD